ncbi:MAG TPA: flagellar hook-basal body complex protein FliE [Bryobacteraceae bacterium]|jgi:flagellar hook-basal body complex protein FliE|nr:flagellar hook-basal body complex protein FliE [Bryobacteraceae bacterium]
MPAPILPISGGALPEAIRPAGQSQAGGAFQDVFTSAIQDVEAFGQNATASAQRFLSGEGEELHTTIMAAQRAELAFDMFLQVRNKVVSAYQEIMRMQM